MFEVLRPSSGDLFGTVLLNGRPHDHLTDLVAIHLEGYDADVRRGKVAAIEDCLNLYFDPIPGTEIPIVFADKMAGRMLIKNSTLATHAEMKVKRKGEVGAGYTFSIDSRTHAVWVDERLHVGRALGDIEAHMTRRTDVNCFVRDGWSPGVQAQIDAARRVANANAGEGDVVKRDTGRYFSVHLPPYALPAIDDPFLHDRIFRAISRHANSPGFQRGWQAKHDLWCRGDEAFSMTFRSLHLGAIELGETSFGRLVVIKDKPTSKVLIKPAAFSPEFAKTFYGQYLNVERRAQDANGWGLKEYEAACFAGDEQALNSHVFLTLTGTGQSAETARKMFRRIMEKAKIMCGDRYAWMHLGRHERIETALDAIEALNVPESVKALLRAQVGEYVGWRDPERWLKVYGRKHYARRDATRALGFAETHAKSFRKGSLPAPAPARVAAMASLFGGR